MTQDHYAILGVTPTAEPAVIRAAYLALMREYHPDRNPSAAATLRAQAIIAAFRVVGDFDRRNEYDWSRRRERERAAAAASPSRKIGRGAVAIGAIGLAAAAAFVLRPAGAPVAPPVEPPRVEVADAIVERSHPSAKAKVPKSAPIKQAKAPAPTKPEPEPRVEQVRIAAAEPKRPEPTKPGKAARTEPEPKKQKAVKLAKAEPVRAIAKPVPAKPRVATASLPAKPKPVARIAPPLKPANYVDLASLDQFVMSFYGQSWRYGDARKRAALEQSRASFVGRRGACLADSCKRAAYLKLMRDVSTIVESGQAKSN